MASPFQKYQGRVLGGDIITGSRTTDNIFKGVDYYFDAPKNNFSFDTNTKIFNSYSDINKSFGFVPSLTSRWGLTGFPNEGKKVPTTTVYVEPDIDDVVTAYTDDDKGGKKKGGGGGKKKSKKTGGTIWNKILNLSKKGGKKDFADYLRENTKGPHNFSNQAKFGKSPGGVKYITESGFFRGVSGQWTTHETSKGGTITFFNPGDGSPPSNWY